MDGDSRQAGAGRKSAIGRNTNANALWPAHGQGSDCAGIIADIHQDVGKIVVASAPLHLPLPSHWRPRLGATFRDHRNRESAGKQNDFDIASLRSAAIDKRSATPRRNFFIRRLPAYTNFQLKAQSSSNCPFRKPHAGYTSTPHKPGGGRAACRAWDSGRHCCQHRASTVRPSL